MIESKECKQSNSMLRMATTVLLLMVLYSIVAGAAAQQALPGCRDRCGNITVPYPFGIDAGCYRDDGWKGFKFDCHDSGPFFLGNLVAALSLAAGEATTYLSPTTNCYNFTSPGMEHEQDTSYTFIDLDKSIYLFSSNKTRLVALGCPIFGYFLDRLGNYVSGCTSLCRPTHELPSPCTGVGCCQTAIPPGVSYFGPHRSIFTDDPTLTSHNTSCQYLFLVETEWFDSFHVNFNRTDVFDVPIVLDWAIRNVGNCSATRQNQTDFACRSVLSECVDSTNGL